VYQRLATLLRRAYPWDLVGAGVLGTMAVGLPPDPLGRNEYVPLALVVIWYLVLGRKAGMRDSARHSLVYSSVMIPLTCWVVWANPNMTPAVFLFTGYILWANLPNRPRAIGFAVGLSFASAAGHVLSDLDPSRIATRPSSLIVDGIIVPVVAVPFTVLACIWLDDLFRWGQRRLALVDALTEAQNRQVALEREAATLAERARFAQDVHDTIAQDLAGLRMLVQSAQRQAQPPLGAPSRDPGADRAQLRRTFGLVDEAVDSLLAQTRELIATTMPVSEDSSLKDVAGRIAARFERETGLSIDVDVPEVRLAKEIEVIFIRCLQEGLSNVRKHANAHHVDVSVRVTGDQAELTLSDDGVGLSAVSNGPGFGISGMRRRVELAGGSLDVVSPGPGQGTQVFARVPLRDTDGADDSPDQAFSELVAAPGAEGNEDLE